MSSHFLDFGLAAQQAALAFMALGWVAWVMFGMFLVALWKLSGLIKNDV